MLPGTTCKVQGLAAAAAAAVTNLNANVGTTGGSTEEEHYI